MKKLLFLSLLFICLTVSTPVFAFDLDSLLVKSVGGDTALVILSNLETWEMRGDAVFAGQNGTFVRYLVKPNKYYLKVTMPGFSLTHASDGETAWQTDLNSRVSELRNHVKEELLQEIYMASFEYLFIDTLEAIASYGGIKEHEGKFYHEVAFFPFEDDTVFSYYDTATGLESHTVLREEHYEVYTYLSDYRNIGGLLVPFHVEVDAPDAMTEMEFTLTAFELNQLVDTTVFAMPDDKPHDFRFPDGVDHVTLEVKYQDGHITVPVLINGKKVWMLLDTGASAHIINQSVARDLNLPEVGLMGALGVGGTAELKLVQTDSIQIGDLTLLNQVAGSMDLGGAIQPLHGISSFGGLLGQDFWSRFPILVDYYYDKLTVYNPESFTPPPDGIEIPFHLTSLIPTIACTVEGIPGDFIVDIGNSSGLLLNKYFVDVNELEDKLAMSIYSRRYFGGIGGYVSGRNAYTAEFGIGEVKLRSLLVFVPDEAVGMMGSEETAGNIGNRILEKFRVLFDYDGSRMFLYRY